MINKIDQSVLTGQGLPDSNPYKAGDGDIEELPEEIKKRSKQAQRDLAKADYISELENSHDDTEDSDDGELYL